MRVFVLVILLVASTGVVAEGVLPTAADLPRLAAASLEQNKPIVLVFTADYCEYCDRLKAEVIHPLLLSPEAASLGFVREINRSHLSDLVDFDGSSTGYGEFAARHQVSVVPTVVVLLPGGRQQTQSIVGYNGSDFYIARLEEAIAKATPSAPRQ